MLGEGEHQHLTYAEAIIYKSGRVSVRTRICCYQTDALPPRPAMHQLCHCVRLNHLGRCYNVVTMLHSNVVHAGR